MRAAAENSELKSSWVPVVAPQFMLHQKLRVPAELDAVWDFFSKPQNLGAMTPPEMVFERETKTSSSDFKVGSIYNYRIRAGGMPMGWRSLIAKLEPNSEFVDIQLRGPYRCWYHTHRFVPIEGGTLIEDIIYYRIPGGLLSGLIHRWLVRPMIENVFRYRDRVSQRRFGHFKSV